MNSPLLDIFKAGLELVYIFSSNTCDVILIGLGDWRATKFSYAIAMCPYVFGHTKTSLFKGP